MIHRAFAVRDTCVGVWLMPWFFQNSAAAVRALGDAVNKAGSDNNFYQHPEHYQLYEIGSFCDDSGMFTAEVPQFIVDCQSLVKGTG